jgi:hypothetical protein
MYNIIEKKNGVITILAAAETLIEAERLLIEKAQKNGGKFENVREGIQLIKKDNNILEYKKYIKIKKGRWLISTSENCSELIAEYSISNNNENLIQSVNEKIPKNGQLLKIVIIINSDGSINYGLIDSNVPLIIPQPYDVIREKLVELEEIIGKNSNIKMLERIITHQSSEENINKNLIHKEENKLTKIELAKKLVELLSNERSKDYVTWMHVNYVLHNIDEELYDCFVEFSKKGGHEFKCSNAWSLRNLDFNITHLHRWAKNDNLDGYIQVMNQY